jgi:hypothetical protein
MIQSLSSIYNLYKNRNNTYSNWACIIVWLINFDMRRSLFINLVKLFRIRIIKYCFWIWFNDALKYFIINILARGFLWIIKYLLIPHISFHSILRLLSINICCPFNEFRWFNWERVDCWIFFKLRDLFLLKCLRFQKLLFSFNFPSFFLIFYWIFVEKIRLDNLLKTQRFII